MRQGREGSQCAGYSLGHLGLSLAGEPLGDSVVPASKLFHSRREETNLPITSLYHYTAVPGGLKFLTVGYLQSEKALGARGSLQVELQVFAVRSFHIYETCS